MKKAFLLLSFIITLSAGLLAQDKSSLTISTTGSSNLRIIFAGKKYSLQDRSETFQNQNPGTYSLVIYQWQYKQSGSEYVKVYDGSVKLNNRRHVELTVMRFGKTAWDESDIEPDSWNENQNNPRPIRDNDYNNNYQNGWRGATATEFANVKKALANEYNEEERLTLAKVIFKNNWFSVAQVREIAQTFYNEERKLRFLKFAYDFCVEKASYFSLADVFYSSFNKKDFISFLGTK
jgi:Domain of unknown function (DUF4476)